MPLAAAWQVSNLGQQATAFLDRLDHNFEQIFKAEDHDATTDVTSAARSQTQAAAAAAAGVPGTAGARSFALAGKQAGGVKGGKLGTTKGKLGANRLSAASSTRPATGTGEAANMSHGVQRAPAAAAPTTQGYVGEASMLPKFCVGHAVPSADVVLGCGCCYAGSNHARLGQMAQQQQQQHRGQWQPHHKWCCHS